MQTIQACPKFFSKPSFNSIHLCTIYAVEQMSLSHSRSLSLLFPSLSLLFCLTCLWLGVCVFSIQGTGSLQLPHRQFLLLNPETRLLSHPLLTSSTNQHPSTTAPRRIVLHPCQWKGVISSSFTTHLKPLKQRGLVHQTTPDSVIRLWILDLLERSDFFYPFLLY